MCKNYFLYFFSREKSKTFSKHTNNYKCTTKDTQKKEINVFSLLSMKSNI